MSIMRASDVLFSFSICFLHYCLVVADLILVQSASLTVCFELI